MLSENDVLREMIEHPAGQVGVRRVLGEADRNYRFKRTIVERLVEKGHAAWVNHDRTIAQITRAGRISYVDLTAEQGEPADPQGSTETGLCE